MKSSSWGSERVHLQGLPRVLQNLPLNTSRSSGSLRRSNTMYSTLRDLAFSSRVHCANQGLPCTDSANSWLQGHRHNSFHFLVVFCPPPPRDPFWSVGCSPTRLSAVFLKRASDQIGHPEREGRLRHCGRLERQYFDIGSSFVKRHRHV